MAMSGLPEPDAPAPPAADGPPVNAGSLRFFRLPPGPWGMRDILVVFLLTLIAMGFVFLIAGVLVRVAGIPSDAVDSDELGAPILLMAQAVLDIAAVSFAAMFSLRKYHLGPERWGLRRLRPVDFGACALVLAGTFAVLVVYRVVVTAIGLDQLEPENNVPSGLFEHRSVLPFTLALVVVIAPLTEEMFFRGFIFNGLRNRLGLLGAAALSGLLFAGIHVTGSDLVGLVVPFTAIGFMFAMLVARTGSLWNSIAVHAAFNLIGVIAQLST